MALTLSKIVAICKGLGILLLGMGMPGKGSDILNQVRSTQTNFHTAWVFGKAYLAAPAPRLPRL